MHINIRPVAAQRVYTLGDYVTGFSPEPKPDCVAAVLLLTDEHCDDHANNTKYTRESLFRVSILLLALKFLATSKVEPSSVYAQLQSKIPRIF
jgi:hypothetical protein